MRTGARVFGVAALALLLAVAQVATAGVVNQWSFEEGAGTTTADSVGGQTGTLTNMAPATDWVASAAPVPSGTSFALDFDGSNDHVVATGYKGVTGTNPRSMSAWINTSDLSGTVISWGNNVGTEKWTFRTQNTNGPAGTMRVEVNGGFQVGFTPVDDGQWHHVAATWQDDGSPNVQDVRLWVDGELEGLGAWQSKAINTASGNDVRIGTSVSGDGKHLQGQIDEVRVYDHALDRQEVRVLAGKTTDGYWQAVQADAPIAYWRLGETTGGTATAARRAFNEGSLGSEVAAAYTNAPSWGQASLVPLAPNMAVRFDGSNDQVNIPVHADIASGGPYSEKTIEAWFSTDAYPSGTGRRVIYDQGGTTHGMNLYTQLDGGTYYLRHGAWHNNGTQQNHFPARVEIDPETPYHAMAVYDDADDSYILYLNGAPVSAKVNSNIESIPTATSSGGIGAKRDATRFDSGSSTGDGNRFMGVIDEVSLYNAALGIRAVQTHYEAATGSRLGITPGAALGVALNYDAGLDSDGDTTWQDTIGSRPNNASLNQFDWNLGASGAVPRTAVSSFFYGNLTHAYQFDGSDAVTTSGFESLAGNPTNNSASFEILFRPRDLRGNEVLFESGGATDGLSMTLQDGVLHFDVKDDARNARAQFDLSQLTGWEQADFLHVVGVADLDANEAVIYVNGPWHDSVVAAGTVNALTDWAGSDGAGLGSVSNAINFGSPGGFDGDIALFRFYPWALGADDVAANFMALEPRMLPEPGTLSLLALGGLGLLCRRRRNKAQRGRRGSATRVLGIVLVALLLAPTQVGRAGLVAHWKLDDGTGSATAADAAGGHTGTLTNMDPATDWVATPPPPVPSGTTYALDFDGTNDHVVATGYKGVTGTSARSMSAWINTSDLSAAIVSWGQDSAGQKWTFRVQNTNGTTGAIRAEVSGGYIVGNLDVADGQWHHVAATWEDDGSPNVTDVKLYVDGARQATSARQGQAMNTASNADVQIGTSVPGDTKYFQGQIDEVRVYDHALSGREVRLLATGSTMPVASLNYDAGLDTDGDSEWEDTVGLYATGSGLDFQLTGVTRRSSVSTSRAGIRASYAFDGSATANLGPSNMEDEFRGNPTDNVASFEIWFKPSDLSGQEILWEIGGSTDGASLTLNDNLLQLVAKDDSNTGGIAADLTGLANDFIQAVAVIDRDSETLRLFVNGVESAGSLVSLGNLADWAGNDGGTDGALGSSHGNAVGGSGGALGNLNGYGNFVGDLALFRMYTEALSPEDVRELYVATAVPEPCTLTLLGLGGIGLLCRRRRRKPRRSRRGTAMGTTTRVLAMVLLALALGTTQVARADLVAHWMLDDGSGTTAADSSGNDYHGEMQNFEGDEWVTSGLPPVPSGTTGALRFDGTGSGNQEFFASNGNPPGSVQYKGVTGTAERSLSAWIKVDPSGNPDGEIISWGNNTAERKWIFRVQHTDGVDGAVRIEVNGGYIVGTTDIRDGQWHHVAAVLPPGVTNVNDVLLFVDGLYNGYSARQAKAINTDSGANVRVGRGHGDHYFEGEMDDVRVYDNALSATDIWKEKAGVGPTTSYKDTVLADMPIAYWRLGETSGTSALSSIGGNKTATYSGGVTLGVPSLLNSDDDPSARFDGVDGVVRIADSADINTVGPWEKKSVELWFKADEITTTKQVILELGGHTRGISIYTVEESGQDLLYAGMWSLGSGQDPTWEHFFSTPIDEGREYYLALVLDSNDLQDASGQLVAYLDGAELDSWTGANRIFSFGDDGAIGGMIVNGRFHDGNVSGNGLYFDGTIDEVALYNLALSPGQIGLHYQLGVIPEPGTLSLLGLGALGLLSRRRRRA